MIHHRQSLPLAFETGDDLLCIHPHFDDFERDLAPHWLLLLGHIHNATPALAQFFEQFVAPDPIARFLAQRKVQCGSQKSSGIGRFIRQESAGVGLGLNQLIDFSTQGSISSAGLRDERCPFPGIIDLQRIGEDVPEGVLGFVHRLLLQVPMLKRSLKRAR